MDKCIIKIDKDYYPLMSINAYSTKIIIQKLRFNCEKCWIWIDDCVKLTFDAGVMASTLSYIVKFYGWRVYKNILLQIKKKIVENSSIESYINSSAC